MKAVRFLVVFIFVFTPAIFSSITKAQSIQLIEATPTGWRMQDYTDGGISLYFTGSPCASGHLFLPAGVSADSKQRFWSMITTAKAAKLPVGIYYSVLNGQCEIKNFYLRETG